VGKSYVGGSLGSGVARGGKWRHAPWDAGFGGAPAHFLQSFYKHVLSRNLDQSMLKNTYFLKKDV